MLVEVSVDQPVEKLLGDWDLLEETVVKKFSRFKRVGQGIYGVRRRMVEGNVVTDALKGELPRSVELGPNGVSEVDFEMLTLRVTAAGTPHRVPHNFGFWHINDMDELYLTVPGAAPGEPAYFIVIMQHPDSDGNEGESFAQYCQRCYTLLHERRYETGRLGFDGVFRFNEAAVSEYNADSRARICPECGHENPLGYTWNALRDSPEMAAARLAW